LLARAEDHAVSTNVHRVHDGPLDAEGDPGFGVSYEWGVWNTVFVLLARNVFGVFLRHKHIFRSFNAPRMAIRVNANVLDYFLLPEPVLLPLLSEI